MTSTRVPTISAYRRCCGAAGSAAKDQADDQVREERKMPHRSQLYADGSRHSGDRERQEGDLACVAGGDHEREPDDSRDGARDRREGPAGRAPEDGPDRQRERDSSPYEPQPAVAELRQLGGGDRQGMVVPPASAQ
jgi:hypothetical protein